MKVAVIGTGYVGLVSGVCLAAKGHDVTCVDVNPDIVSRLNAGEPTIYEKGLPELLAEVRKSNLFRATENIRDALAEASLVVVAVGTPSEKGVIDLRFVKSAVAGIGDYIKQAGRHISVIIKSTVIPGTTDTVVRETLVEASGKKFGEFGLGMNPEFLREGEAIQDFMFPDRIVMGHEDDITLSRLEELYAPWDVEKVRVNTRTAEMIKYANNCLLAIQISAANELANLAASLGGIDIMDVMQGVFLDKRWSPITDHGRVHPAILSYLVPGCGFGGSCFPKDVQALRGQGEATGLPMRLMNAVLDINEQQPGQVRAVLERHVGSLKNMSVLLLGLAFKPDTDDVRESASLKIASDLLEAGARVMAHDPIAADNFKKSLGPQAEQINFSHHWDEAAHEAAVIIVATAWSEYTALKKLNLQGKIVFDARRLFEPNDLPGVQYLTIGRRV